MDANQLQSLRAELEERRQKMISLPIDDQIEILSNCAACLVSVVEWARRSGEGQAFCGLLAEIQDSLYLFTQTAGHVIAAAPVTLSGVTSPSTSLAIYRLARRVAYWGIRVADPDNGKDDRVWQSLFGDVGATTADFEAFFAGRERIAAAAIRTLSPDFEPTELISMLAIEIGSSTHNHSIGSLLQEAVLPAMYHELQRAYRPLKEQWLDLPGDQRQGRIVSAGQASVNSESVFAIDGAINGEKQGGRPRKWDKAVEWCDTKQTKDRNMTDAAVVKEYNRAHAASKDKLTVKKLRNARTYRSS